MLQLLPGGEFSTVQVIGEDRPLAAEDEGDVIGEIIDEGQGPPPEVCLSDSSLMSLHLFPFGPPESD